MKTIYRILFLSILGIFLFACSDDDGDSVSGNSLQLRVSSDTLVLLEENADKIALTFDWNKGISRPAYDTIRYIFRLDVAGAEFATSTDPDTIEDFTRSYTTLELNRLLLGKWRIHAGEEAILEARIVANVKGPKFVYPEISTTSLVVKTYAPASQPLYLVGDATTAGLDPAKSIRITEVSNGELYEWEGILKAGTFKFLTSQTSLLPSYNRGSGSYTVVERESASDPDNMFEVAVESKYKLELDLVDMTVAYTIVVPYPNIYLIGSAGTGWDLPGNMHQFTMNPDNNNLFELEIDLQPGEIKFLTEANWGSYTFRPMQANGSITSTSMQGYTGGDDLKWVVKDGEGGSYKIIMDVYNMTINYKKL